MKFIFLAMILIAGCGGGERQVYQNEGGTTPPGNSGGNAGGSNGKASFSEAREIMGQYCESCHANAPWLDSDRALRNSSVRPRTANKSMPPLSAPRRMPDTDRARLLSFF